LVFWIVYALWLLLEWGCLDVLTREGDTLRNVIVFRLQQMIRLTDTLLHVAAILFTLVMVAGCSLTIFSILAISFFIFMFFIMFFMLINVLTKEQILFSAGILILLILAAIVIGPWEGYIIGVIFWFVMYFFYYRLFEHYNSSLKLRVPDVLVSVNSNNFDEFMKMKGIMTMKRRVSLFFDVRSYLIADDDSVDIIMSMKSKIAAYALLPTIGTAIYYFRNLTINRFLLFLAILPRIFFLITEISIVKNGVSRLTTSYLEALKWMESGEFSKLQFFKRHSDVVSYDERIVEKCIKEQQNIGMVVSNESTIVKEMKISAKKLEEMYPKNFWAEMAEIFADNQEMIDRRERAEREFREMELTRKMGWKWKVSYISKKGFLEFAENAENLLRQVSLISPRDFIVKQFPEESNWLSLGVDFFLIDAFDLGVKEERIEDVDISDNPMENHAYRHIGSSIPMKSRNGNDDPRLELDDD
jgi:ABC-type multidrug transport system fused ATPase/permease subunit